MTPADMDAVWNGMRRGEAVRKIGGDPTRIMDAVRPKGAHHCYLELHIEQGGNLERAGIPVGVVEGIVSIERYTAIVTGFANHAGTTPMGDRRDALLAAARYIDAVNRVVRSVAGRQVGTVGKIRPYPGAYNVIPGRVETSLGLREAKELVDSAPKPVLENVDKATADKAKAQLEGAGATVELQ